MSTPPELPGGWSGRGVLLTGHEGFLGRHVVDELRRLGANVLADSPPRWDLTDPGEARNLIGAHPRPDLVVHLAGVNGGINLQLRECGAIFFANTAMALNVLEACRVAGVGRVVCVAASCAYPAEYCSNEHEAFVPLEVLAESAFFEGPPHPSVEAHAYAKRNVQLACRYYRRQYGLRAVCVCPTTLFGPGSRFDFDRSKLVCGMVRRFVDAADDGLPEVTCWGSGKPLRELLYVEDAARLLCAAATRYDDSDLPLNLGSGRELSVREIAEAVARHAGFTGRIAWDPAKPDGAMRKRLDLTRMKALLGEPALTDFDVAIRATIEDYRRRKAAGEFA